jgi:hypothetical protein
MKLFETPQIEFTSDDYYTPKNIFDRLDLITNYGHDPHELQSCEVTHGRRG